MPRHTLFLAVGFTACLAACGFSGGGGSGAGENPNLGAGLPPELLFCRSRIEAATSDSEIDLRTAQNLGTNRVADRSGRELDARLHPDGVQVVFTRERAHDDDGSRELFVSSIDNSRAELRLTVNADADDGPCWSPTGATVLFSSDRAGERRLWRCDADGQNPAEFLPADPGSSDREPDWHRAGNRIVFSRRAPNGVVSLQLVNGDGTGLVALTTGAPSASANSRAGDREPSFSPDGSKVVFVRRLDTDIGVLMQVDIGTHQEQLLFDPSGDVCRPRYSPQADRLFLGISQPLQGRPGLRLSSLLADGSDPLLLLPDKRFQLDGLEVLPALPAVDPADAPRPLDTLQAGLLIEAGIPVLGDQTMLGDADGAELILATETYGVHEVAGIDCTFTLPADLDTDLLALRIEATFRVTRIGGDTVLRLALGNPVESRQDTVVEVAPTSTAATTLSFATASLAHISRQRRFTVGVICEIEHGARAEMHIDQVRAVLVPRLPAPAPSVLAPR